MDDLVNKGTEAETINHLIQPQMIQTTAESKGIV